MAAGNPLRTPDGRYLVIRGRLWRASNPALSPEQRSALVDTLMDARRDIAQSHRTGDPVAERRARDIVDATKRALGERGAPWWNDGSPDHNRFLIKNTPYADWYAALDRVETNDPSLSGVVDTGTPV